MISYPRIRHLSTRSGEEGLIHREVFRLVLHLPFDHDDLALQVSQALQVYLRSVGTGLDVFSEYHLGYEPSSLGAYGWERVHGVLSPPTGPRFLDDAEDDADTLQSIKDQFDRYLELTGGEQGLSGYGFFYWSRLPWRTPLKDEVSLVSFSWPTEYLEAHGPEHMRELVLELASLLPYVSGHAGLAFSSHNLYGPSMKAIRDEAFRYPGLDATHGQRSLRARVDGVHWLNFLGPPVLEAVGGVEALRTQLHTPGTTVQPLEDARAVVTLGPVPQAGDLSVGDDLPAYRELARVLEPWLFPCPPHLSWRDCAPEDPRRWWRRFLD